MSIGSSSRGLTISKLQSSEAVTTEEHKTKGLIYVPKEVKEPKVERTPVTVRTTSPDQYRMQEEDYKEWNFAFDSQSESMESCGSDQIITPMQIPTAPFNMYSEQVAPSPHLLLPNQHQENLLGQQRSPLSQPIAR